MTTHNKTHGFNNTDLVLLHDWLQHHLPHQFNNPSVTKGQQLINLLQQSFNTLKWYGDCDNHDNGLVDVDHGERARHIVYEKI